MKKLIVLGLALTLFIASASAQSVRDGGAKFKSQNGINAHRVSPGERFKMKKNDPRYHKTSRRFKRGGHLSRVEKGRLHRMKRQGRHDTFHYRHNGRR